MLTKGSMVLIREDGSRKPVEDLIISDLLFDPWADKYVEVVDILSRTIEFPSVSAPDHGPLYPVILKSGLVSTGRPSIDVMVSPSQTVYHCETPAQPGSPALLQKSTATTLIDRHLHLDEETPMKEVTYFAVFTEREQTLDVSGILLSSYHQGVYKTDAKYSEAVRGKSKKLSRSHQSQLVALGLSARGFHGN